ncbi:probetacellulin isoform X2 [Oryzias melastigma]|uniref:Betacellulin, epidermal growth factor family member n=1 Tax=Oryzias melastigma TaxID=30732 RepID=A0A3B3BH85_ORYME|nr:probetacellulin isoform X2 [Oryzias melastigma]
MAEVYKLYMGIITALALCKYSLAEWNSTDGSTNQTVSPCHLHGDRDNCTEDTGDWTGHFSRCPEELTFYCVHGECRYIEEQKAPSCRCQGGFSGSRCEYVDLDTHTGERRRRLIIGCTIAVLAFLIVLILSICICSNRRFRLWWRSRRRRRRGEEPKKETEKLKMMEASAASAADSTETTHINSV